MRESRRKGSEGETQARNAQEGKRGGGGEGMEMIWKKKKREEH